MINIIDLPLILEETEGQGSCPSPLQPYSQHIDLESCWRSKWPKLFHSSNYCGVRTNRWLQPGSGKGITHTDMWEMASGEKWPVDPLWSCQFRNLMTWILTDLCLGKMGGFRIRGSQTESGRTWSLSHLPPQPRASQETQCAGTGFLSLVLKWHCFSEHKGFLLSPDVPYTCLSTKS